MKKFIGNEALLYAIFPNNNIKVINKSNKLKYYIVKETRPYVLELEMEINGNKENVELYVCPMPTMVMDSFPKLKLSINVILFLFCYYLLYLIFSHTSRSVRVVFFHVIFLMI